MDIQLSTGQAKKVTGILAALCLLTTPAHAQTRQQLKKQVAALTQQNTALTEAVANLKAQQSTLSASNAGLREQLTATQAQVSSLQTQLNDAHTRISTLTLSEAAARQQVVTLQGVLALTEEERNAARSQVAILTGDNARLTVAVQEAEARETVALQREAAAIAEGAEAVQAKSGLEAEIARLRAQVPADYAALWHAHWIQGDLLREREALLAQAYATIAGEPARTEQLRLENESLRRDVGTAPQLQERLTAVQGQLARSEEQLAFYEAAERTTEALRRETERQRWGSFFQWVQGRQPDLITAWEAEGAVVIPVPEP
jgi:predicted  nucleic acid-binding Zn-ribbon protein